MIRTFCTNKIRKTTELSESLWELSPCEGEYKDKIYPVFVPCCWESLPDLSAYRGVCSFKKSFVAEGTVRIVFKGVSHTARVLVDGKEVGTHYNAYTPFSVIAKDLVKGEHELLVYADNSFSEKSALHVPNDYMSYGGISRGVVLEELNGVIIEYLHVVPEKKDNTWKVKVSVRIRSLIEETKNYTLQIGLNQEQQLQIPVQLEGNALSLITEEMTVDHPEIWTMEHPCLHMMHACMMDGDVPVDDLSERFGFRTIETSGKDILLNGRKIRIKGFCRHEDHPMFCCALPPAAMQQDIEIMKDLGANAVRATHYPNDELFLDLCDEQGILVWEENHARGLVLEQMQNPYFEEQAEACIQEMITAHINHPSIIIWGILNECASDTEYGYECYKKQYDLIKAMDISRPRSSASCRFKTDICFGLPEIVSYNLYPEWYHDTPAEEYVKDIYGWVQKESEGSGKPFLVTEIGAGAIYGYRNQNLCKWTEEYQAKALEDQIKAVLDQQGCSGIFIWQFCDVRISNEWFSNRPRTMNNKGIVDEYRRRKLSYETVKALFHSYSDYF